MLARMTLVPCGRCQRHVRIRDRSCPFCAHVAGALLALGALVGCRSTEGTQSEAPGVTPSVSSPASSEEAGAERGGLGALSGGITAGRAAVYGAPPTSDSPRAVVTVETTGASDADERIVSAMLPRMRRCAQRAQADDENVAGSTKLELQIAPDGTVSSAKESGKGSLPAAEVTCMAESAKRFAFEAGGARTITLALRHSRQK